MSAAKPASPYHARVRTGPADMSDFAFLMSPPVVALLAALLAFGVAVLALGAISRRREELRAALAALCAMKWSEFAHHVTAVLSQRGLRPDDLHRRPGDDGFDLRMNRGSARYLVQCKQGGAFHVTAATVREFADMVRLQGAEGGILVTTGVVDAAARRRAGVSGIELIAGNDLWRQLKPLLPLELNQDIAARAAAAQRRQLLGSAAIGLVVGLLAWSLFWTLAPQSPASSVVAAPPLPPGWPLPVEGAAGTPDPSPAITADGGAAPPASGADVAALPMQMPDPTLDAGQLAARRAQAERQVRELPQVANASWTTRSTLLLELHREGEDPVPEAAIAAACEQLVRFEELRYTRLQVQADDPREEDDSRVRWRQCR